jgi:hypothetical protein
MLQKTALIAVLMFSVINFSGCIFLAAGAAGAGTAKWLSDKVTQEIDSPREKVVKASKDVLKSNRINVYKVASDNNMTQLQAKNQEGKQVWVDIRAIASGLTKVDVRVGYLDGEADARKILEQISQKAKSWF